MLEQMLLICFAICIGVALFCVSSMNFVSDGTYYQYSTSFNLATHVPLGLWFVFLALGFLFLYLFEKKPNGLSRQFATLLTIAIVLFIFLLFYGLPYLVEPNPRFVDSWVHGRTAKAIIDSAHIQPDDIRYESYPSSFVIFAALSEVTGANVTILLRISPLLWIVSFFSLMIMFVRSLTRDMKLATVSVLIFGLSAYYLAFHFSPEIFGWLLFFVLLVFLAKRINESNRLWKTGTRSLFVLLSVLMIGITITHPVTQFFVLLIMLLLFAFRKHVFSSPHGTQALFLLCLIMFAAWGIFFGLSYTSSLTDAFRKAIATITSDLSSSIAARPLQETYPSDVSRLLLYRQLLYLLVPLLAILGTPSIWKRKKKEFVFLLFLLVPALISVPLTVFGILPLERPIRMAFIPLSVFSAYFVVRRRKIGFLVVAFLVFTIPLNFAAVYWNEGRAMTHDWEVSSAVFIGSNFNGTVVGEYRDTSIMNYYGTFAKVYNDYYLFGKRPDVFNYTYIIEEGIQLVYVTHLTVMKESAAGNNLNVEEFVNSTLFNIIHSDGYSDVMLRCQGNVRA